MTTPRRENARLNTGELGITRGYEKHNSINKIDRIRIELTRPGGLNRFEAERLGDHVLNSTIAALRKRGEYIEEEWETVPTRHCADGVRVKRYWIVTGNAL